MTDESSRCLASQSAPTIVGFGAACAPAAVNASDKNNRIPKCISSADSDSAQDAAPTRFSPVALQQCYKWHKADMGHRRRNIIYLASVPLSRACQRHGNSGTHSHLG